MEKGIIIKRLAFIKYILGQGNYQSQQPEPMCASSLLNFHDSTELFLHLIAEELNTKTDDNLMKYWDNINPKLIELGKSELTQKESMRRLNKARVSLKHHGNLPSKLDIGDFRTLTNVFFQENTKNIFDIDFDSISMIGLINNQRVKDLLQKAEQEFKEGKLQNCGENLSLAFIVLMEDYEESKKEQDYASSPFDFGDGSRYQNSFFMNIDRNDPLRNFIDSTVYSMNSLRLAVKILSFGIDYKKYAKFSILVPELSFNIAGKPMVLSNIRNNFSEDDFEYCYNFIIESALKLQEFDFTVTRRENLKPISNYI